MFKPATSQKSPASHTAQRSNRLETICVSVHHRPTLLPSLGITCLPSFSGNDPANVHSLSRWKPPLCVCQFIFIPHSDFRHPGPSWCCSNLSLWQGREPLTWLSYKNPVAGLAGASPVAAAVLVPMLVPETLSIQSNLLTVWFFKALYNFGLQPSYLMGYHWLFTLFLQNIFF